MTAAETCALKERYFGQKKNQLREGYGTYIYENQFFRYEGQWQNGKKHGHGRLTMNDGSYYEGAFVDGEIEGTGFRFFALTGNAYTGEFHQGECEGHGVMQYSDGSSYEGNWSRNKRQGYGIHRMCNGAIYQGNFHNHRRHCEGILIYSNGSSYNGNWVKDIKQGHGVMTYKDGSVYNGQWLYDLRHGQGCFTDAISGMKYEGLWINDRPQNISTHLYIAGPIKIARGEFFSLTVGCYGNESLLNKADQGRSLQLTCGIKIVNSIARKSSAMGIKSPSLDKMSLNEGKVTPGEEKISSDMEKGPSKQSSLSRQSSFKSGQSEALPAKRLDQPVLPLWEKNSADEQNSDQDDTEKQITTPFGCKVTLCRLIEREFLPGWQLEQKSSDDLLESPHTLDSAEATSHDQNDETVNIEMGKTAVDVSNKKYSRNNSLSESGEQLKEKEAKESEPTVLSDHNVVNLACRDSSMSEPTLVAVQYICRKTVEGGAGFEFITIASADECDNDIDESNEKAAEQDTASTAAKKRKNSQGSGSKSASRLSNKKEVSAGIDAPKTGDYEGDYHQSRKKDDNLFAEPGEYVLMVTDVTEPPFLGMTLEPAYHVVQVVERKSSKKRSESAELLNAEEKSSSSLEQDVTKPATEKS